MMRIDTFYASRNQRVYQRGSKYGGGGNGIAEYLGSNNASKHTCCAASCGVQLSKVTEKLNGVTDGVGES